MKTTKIDYQSLDQKAYEILKRLIEERKLLPGEKIQQEKLAQELGISRTPLIAALKFLEHEKLVEVKPRRGFYVRLFSTEEMASIFEIREVLEGLSARRAAMSVTPKEAAVLRSAFKEFEKAGDIVDYQAYARADKRFHTYIAEIASREFLSAMLQTLNIISLAYQNVTVGGLIREPNETLKDHLQIIDAICDHDPEQAERCMREHLHKAIITLRTTAAQKANRDNRPKGGKKQERARIA